MSVIYEPKGRAKEYCDLACNLYSGCSFGCTYCYAPAILRKSREEFRNNVTVKKDVLKQLKKDAPKYVGREVLLCFTCDPYQFGYTSNLTRRAIEILQKNGCIVNILTKAGLQSTVDFDLLSKHKSKYGASLTFINNENTYKEEPRSASFISRIEALKWAHHYEIKTWVSLEPVINPDTTLEIIKITHEYVDEYKIGKWNYSPEAKKINWVKFREDAVTLLKKYNKKYYIKQDLREE